MIIRQAKNEDLDILVDLLSQLFSIEVDFQIDAERQKVGLTLLLNDPERSVILIAEEAGCTVGMVTGQLVVSSAAGGCSLLLEDLFICKEYRKRGLASALVKTLEEWALARGAKRMQLVADRTNQPALELYHKYGFSSSRMIALYYPLDDLAGS